jgi:hypothetical protein
MADILHSVQTSGSPELILPLVSTAPGFARWWATDVTEKDGAVELAFFNRQTVYRPQTAGPPVTPAHRMALRDRCGMERHAAHL